MEMASLAHGQDEVQLLLQEKNEFSVPHQKIFVYNFFCLSFLYLSNV